MPEPTLTAGFPNYNHSHYLPQAIEAILSQSRPPDEFIIVDDASTDNSVEIIESYARQDSRLRLVRHEHNQGAVASLDRVQTEARGDWLYLGAADDYVLPGFFAATMAVAAEHPEAGILFGQVQLVADGDESKVLESREVRRWQESLYAPPARFLHDFLQTTPTWYSLTHATIYRRQALLDLGGFRKEVGHLSDTVALRTLALKFGAGYVPLPCATWRVKPDSFAAGEGWDAETMIRITNNLGTLLRSPGYREAFPEDYVQRWQRDLWAMTLERYIWKLREERFGHSPWGLLQGRVYKRLLRLRVALQHHGDVAAFLQADSARRHGS